MVLLVLGPVAVVVLSKSIYYISYGFLSFFITTFLTKFSGSNEIEQISCLLGMPFLKFLFNNK